MGCVMLEDSGGTHTLNLKRGLFILCLPRLSVRTKHTHTHTHMHAHMGIVRPAGLQYVAHTIDLLTSRAVSVLSEQHQHSPRTRHSGSSAR